MKISVIIPAWNEAGNILKTLESIGGRQEEREIIVVDGGSTDGTDCLARQHARVISSELKGRAVQMNVGARQASGELLLFLHADSRLPYKALAMLRRALADPGTIGGTFTLRFDSPKLLLRLIAYFTRFSFSLFHYGDQGIFVRRAVFQELRGFKPMPIMEDMDFLQRLRRMGRVTLIQQPVTTSARRFLRHGIIRQHLLNTTLVILYFLGVNPESLSKWYRWTDCRAINRPWYSSLEISGSKRIKAELIPVSRPVNKDSFSDSPSKKQAEREQTP